MAKIGIRFVKGGSVYNVDTDIENIEIGTSVVVESSRGIELAFVASPVTHMSSEEEIKLLRIATDEDNKKMEVLKKKIPNVIDITNRLIAKYNLEMKLVDVNFTLDGTKVIISYTCEDRVDFRELVKDLAYELKLRIELKQIGVRDQAKILGGIGLCGKECCCKQYLNDFDKVSVKMAKVQGLSLNPTKISGLCGRLMCCLAYENETYVELSSKMPKLNSRVKTKDGVGTVVYNNLFKQMVSVKFDNQTDVRIGEYELQDIEVLANEPKKNDVKTDKPKQESKSDNDKSNQKSDNDKQDKSKAAAPNENKKHYNKFKKKFNKKK